MQKQQQIKKLIKRIKQKVIEFFQVRQMNKQIEEKKKEIYKYYLLIGKTYCENKDQENQKKELDLIAQQVEQRRQHIEVIESKIRQMLVTSDEDRFMESLF